MVIVQALVHLGQQAAFLTCVILNDWQRGVHHTMTADKPAVLR